MGKYTCQHGATAAAKYFSKKLGKAVTSTVYKEDLHAGAKETTTWE